MRIGTYIIIQWEIEQEFLYGKAFWVCCSNKNICMMYHFCQVTVIHEENKKYTYTSKIFIKQFHISMDNFKGK